MAAFHMEQMLAVVVAWSQPAGAGMTHRGKQNRHKFEW